MEEQLGKKQFMTSPRKGNTGLKNTSRKSQLIQYRQWTSCILHYISTISSIVFILMYRRGGNVRHKQRKQIGKTNSNVATKFHPPKHVQQETTPSKTSYTDSRPAVLDSCRKLVGEPKFPHKIYEDI